MAGIDSFFPGDSLDQRRFGVVGWPLDYSLSPAIHNAALSHFRINAVYRALRVSMEEWPSFAQQLASPESSTPLEGLNVTVPFKEKALALANEKSSVAALCGSANTLVRRGMGWRADNTDAPGLAEDLKSHHMDWADKTVVLAGAGGAARSALLTVATGPNKARTVFLVNRSRDRAVQLINEFQSRVTLSHVVIPSDVNEAVKSADLFINATSLGLKPDDTVPIPLDAIHKNLAVYDMIYHTQTPLMRGAIAAGARAVGGKGMLVNQAALAFEMWFETDLKKVHYTPRLLREIMGRAFDAALQKRTQP